MVSARMDGLHDYKESCREGGGHENTFKLEKIGHTECLLEYKRAFISYYVVKVNIYVP